MRHVHRGRGRTGPSVRFVKVSRLAIRRLRPRLLMRRDRLSNGFDSTAACDVRKTLRVA